MHANLFSLAKRLLRPAGSAPLPRWQLHRYRSYEEYVRVQTVANHQKLAKVWVQQKNIERLYQVPLTITHAPIAAVRVS